ncbi:ejaculatory bulb-specific protein 3-like [Epargyreus clarus]|uniref:ejaculatory bulb-specific protein 3-like n=1 Tax=Epargyreus clarus TaxID=520877 RepID=UPI003C2E43F9
MKCVVLLCGFLALVAADTYTTENDDLDIEAVLADKAKHQAFLDCFLDKQPCDEVQADFKKDLPEAVAQACAKCTDAQMHIFNRFLTVSKQNLLEGYNALKAKYDADGKHFGPLEAAIAKA